MWKRGGKYFCYLHIERSLLCHLFTYHAVFCGTISLCSLKVKYTTIKPALLSEPDQENVWLPYSFAIVALKCLVCDMLPPMSCSVKRFLYIFFFTFIVLLNGRVFMQQLWFFHEKYVELVLLWKKYIFMVKFLVLQAEIFPYF